MEETNQEYSYSVRIPITGFIEFNNISASSEKDAIKKAWQKYNDSEIDEDGYNSMSWEAQEQICTGNVFNGELNEQEAWEE